MSRIYIAIVGPSGVGKTTIANYLTNEYDVVMPLCVTTRGKREDDDNYIFVNEEEFNLLKKQNIFFFTSGSKDKYGFIDDGSDSPILLLTSYKNILRFYNEHPNTIIILLSFRDIKKSMALRNGGRMDSKKLAERINYAIKDHDEFFDRLNQICSFFVFTDLYSIDEMNEIVCKYLVDNKLITKKDSRILRRNNNAYMPSRD